MKRVYKPIAVLSVALALVSTACSGSSDSSSAGNKAPVAAVTNDMNTTARSEVKQGGTLKWPIDSLPANYNPNQLDGALLDAYYIVTPLLPSAFTVNAKAELEPDLNYVTSVELTSSKPKQVVTYKLNPKAVWDDGTPVSEADYEASWKSQSGKNEAFQVASNNGYSQIESVKAGADKFEVIVTFAKPYADWKGLFALLLPASASSDVKTFNTGWVDKPMATAGPFKVKGVDQTAKTITLVPNEKWWGDKPKLDSIIFRSIDSDTQVDALANGEIDFMDIGPDIDKLTRAKGIDGVEIRRAAGPNFRHVTINGTGPILKDLDVRRAVALTIDRKVIAKALLGPLGGNAVPLQNHIFMVNQTGYQDNAGEFSKADPDKAKTVLDDAGWKQEGSGTRTKAGKPLELRIVIPSGVATSKQESELMQSMLADVGIKLKIDVVPGDDFFDKYITTGNFDLTVFSWSGTPFPVSSSVSIYAEPQGSGADLDIQQNYARIGNKALDAKFNKATTLFDEKESIALGNEIDADIWKEVHSLALYQRPDIYAAKKSLANMGAYGFASITYQDIGFAK